MKRAASIIAVVLSVGCAVAGWRGRFDEQFAAALNAGTPIPAVAWYKLDGNALDSSGNGYDGTWSGTEAYAAGKFAGTQAGIFTNAMITVADNSALRANQMTFTFWINLSGSGGLYKHVIGKDQGASVAAYQIYLTPPNLAYYSSSTVRFNTGKSVAISEWVHVAMRFDGTTCISYFNGVGLATNNASIGTTTTTPMYIGAWGATRNNPLGGMLDDVRIYNRVLSDANIARIMESQDNEPLEELQ